MQVGVGIVQHKTEMVVVKTLLDYYENKRISCTDICLETDGSIQIITSTGSAKDPIRLHKLTTDVSTCVQVFPKSQSFPRHSNAVPM